MSMKMQPGNKPSRSEAYSLIVDMKFGRGSGKLEDFEVDKLLRFFAPALPAKAKGPEQWVAKAVSKEKNENRAPLRYVYVKEGVAYGCDGHRAHRCKTALPDGYYDATTLLPVEFDGLYPEILKVFPTRSKLKEFDVSALEYGALKNEKRATTTEFVRVPDSTAVNRHYLSDALNGAEGDVLFYESEASQKMAGDSEFGDWVIMGMRV